LRLYLRILLVTGLAVALATPVTLALAAAKPPPTAKNLAEGRKLYRKYCGQCHVLTVARAVGFGQDKPNTDPGPSLDNLKVPWNLTVSAIVLAISGHETIQHEMTWREIAIVATYVDKVTKHHKIPAKITGANFTTVLPPAKKP
jgi:mono/diheme cytochrome c family protein